MTSNSIEVVKRRPLLTALMQRSKKRIIVCVVAGGTMQRIAFSMSLEAASVAADWYDASGDKISALMLLARIVELTEGRTEVVEKLHAELDALRFPKTRPHEAIQG